MFLSSDNFKAASSDITTARSEVTWLVSTSVDKSLASKASGTRGANKRKNSVPHTLTDVIWLIGIVRRLGTQLASSLCPKPSVPINQMTPAFNIWGLLGWLICEKFCSVGWVDKSGGGRDVILLLKIIRAFAILDLATSSVTTVLMRLSRLLTCL
ncbi:hypothetical protein TYRP_001486 [Tyrophagus putrescentiae]|nr:hypothetical protein TYRP_001486 [Tyrophagus putrescentiae]